MRWHSLCNANSTQNASSQHWWHLYDSYDTHMTLMTLMRHLWHTYNTHDNHMTQNIGFRMSSHDWLSNMSNKMNLKPIIIPVRHNRKWLSIIFQYNTVNTLTNNGWLSSDFWVILQLNRQVYRWLPSALITSSIKYQLTYCISHWDM